MELLLVGDVMLGRLVNDLLKGVPPDYPWGDTLPLFDSVDLRICNLECVIANSGSPWVQTPKVFHFRSDAHNVAVLKEAGINLVSLANNHTLDYGYEAMLEMLTILKREKIGHAGAGENLKQAEAPATLEVKGLRIGFLAFTDNEPVWEAKENRAGIYYLPIDLGDPRVQKLLQVIDQTKKVVDFLIVSAHWGPNWGYRPQASHIPFAHAFIEKGADLVFGHSGHVFQGIEIYQGHPILYSTGDFIDDYAVDRLERNDQSFIFIVKIENGEVKGLKLYPTVIDDFQARLAQSHEVEEIASKMQTLSAEFGTKLTWEQKEQCLSWIGDVSD